MRAADRDRLTVGGEAAPEAGLDMSRVSRMMLDAAGVGLAVADGASREIRASNARMREWFGLDGTGATTLDSLFPGLDANALAECVAANRELSLEVEVPVRRRKLSLAVRIGRGEAGDGAGMLMVECQNVSRLRELEYMLQSYSAMVEKKNRDLTAAKDRVERVLLNIMPKTVYEEWRRFGVTTPRLYENATILMLDFVGFTEMAVTSDPPELIRELNDIFTGFDRIVEQFGCERLKTIGDAYMAVSGLPLETPEHAINAAGVALRMRRFLERRNAGHPHQWRCRIGVHSGPVVGSIVGVQKYVYDVFGPGVNTAARLEAMATPMEILVSDATRRLLDARFTLSDRGVQEIRGAGPVRVHSLEGSDDLGV